MDYTREKSLLGASVSGLEVDPYFERPRNQYTDKSSSDFVHLKDLGAKGDGKHDDTSAIQKHSTNTQTAARSFTSTQEPTSLRRLSQSQLAQKSWAKHGPSSLPAVPTSQNSRIPFPCSELASRGTLAQLRSRT